jgi:hypothetical protein
MNVGCQGLEIGWEAEVSATFVLDPGFSDVISRNSFMVVICRIAMIAIEDLFD